MPPELLTPTPPRVISLPRGTFSRIGQPPSNVFVRRGQISPKRRTFHRARFAANRVRNKRNEEAKKQEQNNSPAYVMDAPARYTYMFFYRGRQHIHEYGIAACRPLPAVFKEHMTLSFRFETTPPYTVHARTPTTKSKIIYRAGEAVWVPFSSRPSSRPRSKPRAPSSQRCCFGDHGAEMPTQHHPTSTPSFHMGVLCKTRKAQ